MYPTIPLNAAIATGLAKAMPAVQMRTVDWLNVADDFLIAIAGSVTVLPKDDYDRKDREFRRAKEYLRALGITL